ncbi:MAG: ABC transporter substrate-binding protein [Oscillospiraceae bacterium]|nr:ABC transporter substrate-binding protein [Oscillospiraceae bacterium]MBQ6402737.1 ABC transporter substrate-binding protein [Oscillospiraceae bacterium]
MKKFLAMALALVMLLGLAACGSKTEPAADGSAAEAVTPSDDAFVVGICQLVQHEALDAATQGFKDALIEAFGEDGVVFDEQNAAGDPATCSTICDGFVTEGVDLILANATPALQAAATATDTIPVLGTSITEYGVALDLDNFNGVVGTNVSGTSDLAPLDEQAKMVTELCPDAKTVGILYCASEANSVYQAEVVKSELEAAGLTVNVYTFSDSNDVAAVTGTACDECDALYIPTDNTAASCTEAINNVAQPAGVPIIAGEEGLCKGCGIATLSISYYELGVATGEMAAKILKGEANVAEMEIGYDPNPVKKYNPELVEALGVTIPDDYTAIEG